MVFSVLGLQDSQASVAEPNDYSIATIESDIRPMDKVGPLKIGILCLPKGKLLWRDIARPGDQTAINILLRRLSALGLMIANAPDPLFSEVAPLTKYRIRVTYEAMTMSLCIAGMGIGKRPSGQGRVLIRWETFDRSSKSRVANRSFEVLLSPDGRDARNVESVIGDALRSSADQYVLSRRDAPTALP
ncbi:MAG: hypothetical protein JWO15_200 [Sphingomonadales bacterium]|nr:hypothetical protein [Sphingomonadales bacterium]